MLYVVGTDIVEDESLFGAHSGVAPETASALRNILKKWKRGDDSDEEAAGDAAASGSVGTGAAVA